MKKYILRHSIKILQEFNKLREERPLSLDIYIKKYFKSHKSGKIKSRKHRKKKYIRRRNGNNKKSIIITTFISKKRT